MKVLVKEKVFLNHKGGDGGIKVETPLEMVRSFLMILCVVYCIK